MKPIYTLIPDQDAIELIAYYPSFLSYYPQCELQTKRWFVEHVQRDWVMFDAGANIGYYSILFSRLAPDGKVFAFEPTETIKLLQANLDHHRCSNVTPLQVALGTHSGAREDDIFRIWGENPERRVYQFSTVDDMMKQLELERIDCIKIDVDSFDLEVLRGAKQTLTRYDPWVVVELNYALAKRNQSVPEALEWLYSVGYRQAHILEFENYVLHRRDEKATQTSVPSIALSFENRPLMMSESGPSSSALLSRAKRRVSLAECRAAFDGQEPSRESAPSEQPGVDIIPVEDLGDTLGFSTSFVPEVRVYRHGLAEFKIERDEAAIFSYVYRQFQPRRHLEFGTWEGWGATIVASASDAEIWTINLPEGERDSAGNPCYGPVADVGSLPEELREEVVRSAPASTDSGALIGWRYRAAGFAARVHQILCDSRELETTSFKSGFFDTVFIDGGHSEDVVTSDTNKALPLVRQGGLVIWHDFCPDVETLARNQSPRGVVTAIIENFHTWRPMLSKLFWIRPSWILVGVKA